MPVKTQRLGWDVLPILMVVGIVVATALVADASIGGKFATIVTILVTTAASLAK